MSKVQNVVLGCGLLLAIPSGTACEPASGREYPFELDEAREVFVKVLRTDPESVDDSWQLRFTARLNDSSVRDLGTLGTLAGTDEVLLPPGKHVLHIEAEGEPGRRWDVLLVELRPQAEGSGGFVNPSTHWRHATNGDAGCDAVEPPPKHEAGDAMVGPVGLAAVLAAYWLRRSKDDQPHGAEPVARVAASVAYLF